jgi:hypothetical protein
MEEAKTVRAVPQLYTWNVEMSVFGYLIRARVMLMYSLHSLYSHLTCARTRIAGTAERLYSGQNCTHRTPKWLSLGTGSSASGENIRQAGAANRLG